MSEAELRIVFSDRGGGSRTPVGGSATAGRIQDNQQRATTAAFTPEFLNNTATLQDVKIRGGVKRTVGLRLK